MSTVPGGIKPRKLDVYFDAESICGQDDLLSKEAQSVKNFVEALSEFFGFLSNPIAIDLYSETYGSTSYKIRLDESGVGDSRKYRLLFHVSGGVGKEFGELGAGHQAQFCKMITDNFKGMIEAYVTSRGKMLSNFRSARVTLEEFFGEDYFEDDEVSVDEEVPLIQDDSEKGDKATYEPSRSVV